MPVVAALGVADNEGTGVVVGGAAVGMDEIVGVAKRRWPANRTP